MIQSKPFKILGNQGYTSGQVKIVNDTHPNKVVIKSRQLGLSEMGVMEMVHFADMHSYANVKCLYTFPKQLGN